MHENYIGAEMIGYIKDSIGFVKKVKYTVHYFGLMGKFITEMRYIPENVIICDNEGIIMEMSPALLYEIPKLSNKLALEDLVGVHILDQLDTNDNKKITVDL